MKFAFYVLFLVVLYESWRKCKLQRHLIHYKKDNTIWKINNMLKKNTVEISFADSFVKTIEKNTQKKPTNNNNNNNNKRNRTVQVQLESLSFPFKSGIEALNNIQQNVWNRHLMMTHGGVEIVVLKYSYIIWHSSDIITEYVNKHLWMKRLPKQIKETLVTFGCQLVAKCKKTFQITWTASSDFGTYSLCEQRRFRRACASAQSRQNLRCSLI